MDRVPIKDLPDTTADRAAAEQQASRIRAYWLKRGKVVKVWVEEDVRVFLPAPLYIIRSDIATSQEKYKPWAP
jgi:hypothetical protein